MFANSLVSKDGKGVNKRESKRSAARVAQMAVDSRDKSTDVGVLRLQRHAGNQAVLQALRAEKPIQRLEAPEEEELQMKADTPVQRQEDLEDEEELQMKANSPVQRQEDSEDEEELQMKADSPVQRQEDSEDEEELQMKADSPVQRQEDLEDEEELQMKADSPVQRQEESEDEEELQMKADSPVQRLEAPEDEEEVQLKADKGNQTGMPDKVKAKMERAFNTDFSDVRIYEGDQAKSVGALAYTQGTNIHFAPGQYQPETEAGQQLLGHELAHVIQQKEGRVKPTTTVKGVSVNDDPSLEQEADRMGERAAKFTLPAKNRSAIQQKKNTGQTVSSSLQPVQRKGKGNQDLEPAIELQPLGRQAGVSLEAEPQKQEAADKAEEFDYWAYYGIIEYLRGMAEKDNKGTLFHFFESMPFSKQKLVIDSILGKERVSLENFKKKIKPSFTKKIKDKLPLIGKKRAETLDWDKFSEAVRSVKEKDTWKEQSMTKKDLFDYVTLGLGKGSSGVGGASTGAQKIDEKLGLNNVSADTAKKVTSYSGASAAGVAALTGLVDSSIKGAELVRDWGTMNATESAQRVAEFTTALGETGKSVSESVKGVAEGAGKEALKKSVEQAVGGFAIGIGAVDLVSGGVGAYIHHRRAQKLGEMARDTSKPEELRKIAFVAQKTQELNRDTSAAKAIKGAVSIVGGALALASLGAAPAVLAIAGVLGGIAAVYRMFKAKKKKEEIVDKILGVPDYFRGPDREQARDYLLQEQGYNTVDQFYNDLMDKYAQYLYEEGVEKDDNPDVVALLDAIGLKVNRKKRRPKKEKIKKKLSM